jgi:hypothetical protein
MTAVALGAATMPAHRNQILSHERFPPHDDDDEPAPQVE